MSLWTTTPIENPHYTLRRCDAGLSLLRCHWLQTRQGHHKAKDSLAGCDAHDPNPGICTHLWLSGH